SGLGFGSGFGFGFGLGLGLGFGFGLGLGLGFGLAATFAASSVGTSTGAVCPALTVIVRDHGCLFGAFAATVCAPGSTGIAVLHSGSRTCTSSRVTTRPSSFERTRIVMRGRRGSSAVARWRAASERACCPSAFACAATSRKPAHAVAVFP